MSTDVTRLQDVAPTRGTSAPPSVDELCTANLLATQDGTAFFFKDLLGRFLRVSEGCAQLAGRTPEQMIGLTDFDLTDEAHASELFADEQRIIATGDPLLDKREFDRLADQPGTLVETSKFSLRDADGAIIGTFGWSRDVTPWAVAGEQTARMAEESAEAHLELVLVEAQLRDVLDGSPDAIAKHDTNLRYQYINPAGLALRHSTREQMIGRIDRELGMSAEALRVWESALCRVLETGEPGAIEISAQTARGGAERWFHTTLSANRGGTGAIVGVLSSTRDVSEQKRAEQALVHQATHDSLTSLANRHLLTDRLTQALVRMERYPNRLTVFFVDLDGFKAVNDTHGHEVGDQVLVEVARRLLRITRNQDTVARLGGDEFVVLCDPLVDRGRVEEIAWRIVATLAEPYETTAGTTGPVVSVLPGTFGSTKESGQRMQVRIHRGSREVGGSCVEVLAGGSRLVLDVGRPLCAGWDEHVPLPDVPGLATGDDPSLLGVVVSHPHLDHYGLLDQVHPAVPVFAGAAAAAIVDAARWFSPSGPQLRATGHLHNGVPMVLGTFTVTPYLVDHSAFDSYAMVVEAAGRRLMYTGDLRGHGRKSRLFEEMLARPPAQIDTLLM